MLLILGKIYSRSILRKRQLSIKPELGRIALESREEASFDRNTVECNSSGQDEELESNPFTTLKVYDTQIEICTHDSLTDLN